MVQFLDATRCRAGAALPVLGAALIGIVTSALGGGCGYHFAGSGRQFAPEVRTISVEAFENRTREGGIGKRLAFAIEREFSMRGPLRVVNGPGDGDVVLTGKVWEAADHPVAFNRKDEVLVYQTTVALDLELRQRNTGEVIWYAQGVRASSDYESVASVIVTTSPEFRQSTLNAEDLGGLTDIQLAESRRRHAIERMVASLARDVYDQIMEDF